MLIYEFVDDYLERRPEFRGAHLTKAWEAVERGDLVLGGAVADPPDGAFLLFQGETPDAANDFANNDPYVANGLVTRWQVREWTTVVGHDAANPVKP